MRDRKAVRMVKASPHASNVAKPPRKASRGARRTQLIEATIDVLAMRGYARTTLTEVARHAGLSHGLVNFHFESKEKLLSETMLFLAEEYRLCWSGYLAQAGDGAAEQLNALICADFQPEICTAERLSAWCSFWGEAQSRPIYQQKCGSNDDDYITQMEGICARLIEEGGYRWSPVLSARALRATIEGVWLDMMTMQTPYPAAEGLSTVMSCAAAFFPKHFNTDGLIAD